MRRMMRGAGLLACMGVAACGAPAAGVPASPAPAPAAEGAANGPAESGIIPAGHGTLRQDDIAVKLELDNVLVKLIPLDENVIRVLSPDSYRALHDLLASKQATVSRYAALHGLHERNVWYVAFYGLAPDALFTPLDLTVSAPGRDFRPLEVIPLSPGFGQNRLQVREMQSALYLFDDGLPLNQPLTITMSGVTNANWQAIERNIEVERALVRTRAAKPK